MSTSSSPTPDPKEIVRQDWLSAAPAWKKWYSQLAFQSRQATELVVKGAPLSPGMHVLDLACCFGIMFVPNIQKALREMRRVLKPGGRVSFVTWGSMEENPLFSTMIKPFLKYVDVPPPPPYAPQVFRFADESKLDHLLCLAGFHDIHVAKHQITWPRPATPEEAWQGTSELAAPFKRIIAATPPDKRELAIHEAIENFRSFYDGQAVTIPATINSATAATPAQLL